MNYGAWESKEDWSEARTFPLLNVTLTAFQEGRLVSCSLKRGSHDILPSAFGLGQWDDRFRRGVGRFAPPEWAHFVQDISRAEKFARDAFLKAYPKRGERKHWAPPWAILAFCSRHFGREER
jgi:hypothetical protein